VHPRAFGTFPRVLGRYVRDQGVLSLAEAVRCATRLPAEHLGLDRVGVLAEEFHADVVVFDPSKILDLATFQGPRMSVGVDWVLVNGEIVVAHGKHTGAKPGQVLRGRGFAN